MGDAGQDAGSAYAGVEDLDSFPDRRALGSYRDSVQERSRPQADFLLPRLDPPTSVLEVASGNGRLMIELADRGALAEGLGIDIAASRIEFARRWAEDSGHAMLRFEAADALREELGDRSRDLVVCITGAFGYFEPLASGSALNLARRMCGALKPGGLLCLELYPSPRYRRLAEAAGGEVRLWSELPPEDPWRFYLSHLTLDGTVLIHEKTFLHRETGEVDSGRTERLQLYSTAEIAALLEEAGLEGVEAHEGWSDNPYDGGESMVVTARRPASGT
jgi:SAM-dependent methyltransferase